MKDFVIIIKIGKVEDKEIWKSLRIEGFNYVGNRTMVKCMKSTITAIEKYKAYLEDLIINYDNVKLKIIEF